MSIRVKEIAFTGYPVTDFEKARAFYTGLLGLTEADRYEEGGELHWLEYDIAGATLALAKASEQWQPHKDGGGVALEVEDLDATLEHLRANGVETPMGVGDFPTCRISVVNDPDGNGVALHQRKAHHPDYSN